MDRYIINIIKLLNDETYTSIDYLMYQLSVSQRTIRNSIQQFEDKLKQNGFTIEYKSKKGYILSVFNKENYYQFIKDDLKKELANQLLVPIYNEQRIEYCIRKFLTENKEIKLEDLADELYVSRSTINRLIKDVKLKFQEYHLDIINPKGKGLILSGKELNYRSCIAHYFFRMDSIDKPIYFDYYLEGHNNQDLKRIQDIVYEILHHHQFKLNDIGFQNLVVHLLIAISRIKEKIPQDIDNEIYQKIRNNKVEYEIACQISSEIEKVYGVEFDDIENLYITIHLLSKKVVNDNDVLLANESNVKLINQIIKRINYELNYDFTKDIDLHNFLLLHLDPLMTRLHFGLKMANPLLDEIKAKNTVSFEIGVIAADEMSSQTGYMVPEEEIGYLALHFALALERLKQGNIKKKIVVVCATGGGSSRLLKYQLQRKFGIYLEDILVSDLFSLSSVDLENYDYIFTTVPIPFVIELPIIHITNFLNVVDIQNIENVLTVGFSDYDHFEDFFDERLFFNNESFKDKNEIIHFLCEKIKQYYDIPDNYEELVLEREKIAGTEIGNYIALPHPLKLVSEEFFLGIVILKKPIIWVCKPVKYVLLLSMPIMEDPENEILTQAISKLVSDESILSLLEEVSTLNDFINLLRAYTT